MSDESESTSAPVPKKTAAQLRKEAEDTLLADLETKLSALTPEQRKNYFFENKDADSLKLVNLLSARVDCIRDAGERKKYFLAHPELEVRYSAANFTPSGGAPK
jgi:hypothetical protein